VVQHSVSFSIGGDGDNVKLLGEIISAFSPSTKFSHHKRGEWTRRDSNPHLRLGQSAVLPLHHGPYGEFPRRSGVEQGCGSQCLGDVSKLGMAAFPSEDEAAMLVWRWAPRVSKSAKPEAPGGAPLEALDFVLSDLNPGRVCATRRMTTHTAAPCTSERSRPTKKLTVKMGQI
jgi:hypothetical protein